MKRTAVVLLAGLLGAPLAYAEEAHHKGSSSVAQAGAALSEGEVRKVDKDAKKITIKHGPLANLDMPPMTMVFQVKNPALLDQAKAGDKVKFRAEKEGAAYVVTQIEAAK
ncbi:MAG TPA: copper-binding protein [Burkholderiales bacterium]